MHASRFGGFAGIVFDAYGTLFDVSGLEHACATVVSAPEAFCNLWRAKQLEYATLRTVMDQYADWAQITSDALDYTTTALKVELDPTQRRTLMRGWLSLPAFPDVRLALDRLAASDVRLLVLSNGTRKMIQPLLDLNQLNDVFVDILTSEAVHTFKPDPHIYLQAPERLHSRMNETLFVSSNGFDIAGSKAIGFTVCRVDRRGEPLDPLGYEPDFHVRNLNELADLLLGDEGENEKLGD